MTKPHPPFVWLLMILIPLYFLSLRFDAYYSAWQRQQAAELRSRGVSRTITIRYPSTNQSDAVHCIANSIDGAEVEVSCEVEPR